MDAPSLQHADVGFRLPKRGACAKHAADGQLGSGNFCTVGENKMLKKIAIVAGLGLTLCATAEAPTPRKGGTIRMTADDLFWTYNRIMDGSKAFPGARYVRLIAGAAEVEKGQAKEISGLKKIDDLTLEMKLTEKVDPGFYFFTALTSIYPADEGAKEGFIQKPIGLGPFKFVEHVPGSRIVLERFDKFYKPGKPYADKVIVSIMAEAAARDVAFRNKEIDTSVLGTAQYVAYQADPNLKGTITEVAEDFTRYMGMTPAYKPFSDKRVRQAINYAIDTDLIISKLVKGKAYRATSWLPLTSPAYDKTMKPYPV